MSQTFSISAKRRYGLTRVCRQWRVSRATLHRHLSAANRPDAPRCRRGPQGAMSDADLAERIRALLADSPFYGEGYRKVWARLRHAGVRTSPRRVLRVMRDHSLLAHQRAGSPRGPRAHDGTITTPGVDEMWGTDMTSVATGEGQAAFGIGLGPCMDGARVSRVDRSSLAFGRVRPCIRRLMCSIAARPDEVRGRLGPNQWRVLICTPVRTGCPLRYFRQLPSSRRAKGALFSMARLRRDALAFLLGPRGPRFS